MSNPAPSTPNLPDWLVQNRNFVCLWAAYGVAAIGDHLSEMALLASRGGLTRPDVTRVQALITFGFFLPFVVLGPLAGWWSDRFSRKATMIAADLLRAILVFNLAFLVTWLAGWLPTDFGDLSIVLPLMVVGALAAFFSPARQAMLPTLIRDDQLVRANALISGLGTIGTIVSAVLGGWLVDEFTRRGIGLERNYHLNALTFGLSAAFVLAINMRRSRAVPHPPLTGVWQPVRAGFRYVRQHRRVLQLVLLGTVFWAAAGAVVSVTPALAKSFFGENYTMASVFRGLMGFGLATGAVVMTIFGQTIPIPIAILASLAGGAFWIIALVVAYAAGWTIPTGVCLFGIGGAGASLLVTIMASLQRFVPDSRRGRVFGVNDMATMGAMVLATGLLGFPDIPDLDRYIPLILSVVAGGFVLSLALAWRRYRRGWKHIRPDTWLTWALTRFYARFWCRAQRLGPCTIPTSGPVIVAANHTSGIDPIMIIGTSPRRLVTYMVAREFYRKPLARYFCDMVHCIPIDRDRPGKEFLAACLRVLRDGGVLGVFPHGRFAVPGEPEPEIKSGVGAIALRTGVPVIPVHIGGTTYHDSPFLGYFRRHSVRIRYGKPVDLSRFAGRQRDKAAADEASELVMQRIRELAS